MSTKDELQKFFGRGVGPFDLTKGAAPFGHEVSMNWMGQRVIADIQKRLYDHVVSADLAFFRDSGKN